LWLLTADGERCDLVDVAGGDFVEAAAELADGVGWGDFDDFFAKLGFAGFDLGFELFAFVEQGVEDLLFGDVGDFLALHVDDAAAVAREDRDVGALGLARTIHDAAHHGDLDRQLDLVGELFAYVLDEGEQVDLDAAARRAGNKINAHTLAQLEAIQHLQRVFDLVHRVVGVADAHGVADAVRQQMPERHRGANHRCLARPGMGHAQMKRVVKTLGDLGIGRDDKRRVGALGGDADVVKIVFVEDVEIFLELGDHDGQEVAVAGIGEDAAELFHAFLLVFALDDRAFVDADADGQGFFLACLDDGFDLLAVLDVARVEADLVDAGVDRFEGTLKVEVHVGDDRHGHLRHDLAKRFGVFFLGHGDTDDVRPGGSEPVDFSHTCVDVVGVASGHGLDGDGRGGGAVGAAADFDDADAVVAERDLTGGSAWGHG